MRKGEILGKIFGIALVFVMIGAMLGGLPGSVNVSASTDVGGSITSNTTWSKQGSPYIVTSSVLVCEGATLTIEPGVVVRFSSAKGMQIEGELLAQGTEAEPIIFSSNQSSPAPGDWVNILFTDTSIDATYDEVGNYLNGSIMQHCTVEYTGWGNTPAIKIASASPFIHHCTVTKNGYHGIYIAGTYPDYASPTISNNTIANNSASPHGGGIYACYGTPTISGNTIVNNSASYGGGIYVFHNTPTISGNTIANNSASDGGGIYAWDGTPTISGNTIVNNSASDGGGIYARECTLTIIGNEITGNSAASSQGGGIHVDKLPSPINYNSIYNNNPCSVYNTNPQGSPHVNATNNWWGTSNETTIQEDIYDWFDDATLGIVDYMPYLTNPMLPDISFSPSNLSFSAVEGGAKPANKTLEIWNSGEGTLNWTLSDDAAWLSEAPMSGNSIGEHDTVAVSANITGMFAGDYTANVSITATGANNTPQVVPVTLHIALTGTLEGNVTFVGRGSNNTQWIETFVVRFFQNGNETAWSPINATTNTTGLFNVTSLTPGTCDIGIKGGTGLSEVETNVTLTPGNTTMVDFGTIRVGDANNDDYITISDRTLLYGHWATEKGDPGWDANCDFNNDGYITISDRTLLYGNWNEKGDLAP